MELHEPSWVWRDNNLIDALGTQMASVRADIIHVGDQNILIEALATNMHFKCRATTSDGDIFTVSQRGFTVTHLDATCGDRHYTLERTSTWRKVRGIASPTGDVYAYVQPRANGRVEVHDGPCVDDMPLLDAVFLTWVCVLVDANVRRPRI